MYICLNQPTDISLSLMLEEREKRFKNAFFRLKQMIKNQMPVWTLYYIIQTKLTH